MAKAKDKGQEPAKTIAEIAADAAALPGADTPGTAAHSIAGATAAVAAVTTGDGVFPDAETTAIKQPPPCVMTGSGQTSPRDFVSNPRRVRIGDKVVFSDGLCEGWLALVTCVHTPDQVDLAVFPPGAVPTHARNVPFGPDEASFRRWFWID